VKRKANRSILTMAITMVVIILFIWHFNRRFEQMKQKSKQDVETTAPSAEQIEQPTPETTERVPWEPGVARRPILTCFCADWQHSCARMSELMDRLKSKFGDRLQARMIDPSDEPELAKQFRIDSLPTFILFDAKGKLTLRAEGVMTEQELILALGRIGLDE